MDKDYKIVKGSIDNAITAAKNWKSSLDAIPSKVTTTVETIFKTVGGRPTAGLRAYQFGGIVPSTQAILAHRGEMLLTPRDQRNLFEKAIFAYKYKGFVNKKNVDAVVQDEIQKLLENLKNQ